MPRPTLVSLLNKLNIRISMFDGFPYISTYVVPTFYHIILLPSDLSSEELVYLGRVQGTANQLKTCVVLKEDFCVYVNKNGDCHESDDPPMASNFITDRLRAPQKFPETEELKNRKKKLDQFIKDLKMSGYLLGDLKRGGRKANQEELRFYSGFYPNGVPNRLVKCGGCGGWFGECLDPIQSLEGMIIRVHCLCQNDSFCAYCRHPLDERKLNANYYEADGNIWHTPGFCGFRHTCILD